MGYKMIFIDLDETLLDSRKMISKENIFAVKKAVAAGIHVVICTGRAIFSVGEYVQVLKLNRKENYIICQNGCNIYNTESGELLLEKTMDHDTYSPIIDNAKKHNVDIQIYRDRDFYIESITPRTEKYIKIVKEKINIIKDFNRFSKRISCIVLNGENKDLIKIHQSLSDYADNRLNCFFTKPNFLEFTPIDATKGVTMLELADMKNIKAEEIIAVGDSYNDINMIELAGLGIAMKNSNDDVKKIADYVTEFDNNENGVSEIINKFLLKS